jgi:hypothetical protein
LRQGMRHNVTCKCPPKWHLHHVVPRTFFGTEKVAIIRLRLAKLFAIGIRRAAPGGNKLSTLVYNIDLHWLISCENGCEK